MGTVISFEKCKTNRAQYEFKYKSVLLNNENGKRCIYFVIILIERDTKNVVSYTGFERYVVDLSKVEDLSESTYRIAVSRVVKFLNFVLYETKITKLNEITANEIRQFLISIKIKPNGKEMKSDSWNRTKKDVFVFLENYYKYNYERVDFSYTSDELSENRVITTSNGRYSKRIIISENKSLYVNPPKSNNHIHRKRTIMYGHLDALLFAARKYDPMIYLAICLQAYAGLREGEVANLSFSDIEIRKRLGVVEKISIELVESNKYRRGKTPTGVIKKKRKQEVYPDFLQKVEDALEQHKDYLTIKGLPTEGDNPVFYNKHRRPMSVTSLINRIKELFEGPFLRILRESCENTEFEGETYAFLDTYEEEYPGAHMFRHWFTMYLITKKKLRPEEVRKWRGDAPNSNAYEEYMHLNYDLVQAYRNTAYLFQEGLLRDIYD